MLAFEDLEERFKSSTTTTSNHHQNKAPAKTSAPNAVPLLSLTITEKNKHSTPHPPNSKQQAKVVGNNSSSGHLSSTLVHPQHPRDEAKKSSSHRQHQQHQQQQQHGALDSPGSRLTTARSASGSTSGIASGSASGSGSGYMLAHGDATEFVMSIQEYLTMDRIATVLDDIKGTTHTHS